MTTEPRDPQIPDLVSAAEAAAILGISKQAVIKRAERGQLLGARAGSAWVFRRALVEAAAPAPTAGDLPPLPPGDITWDGTTLTAGGVALEPGRYAAPGGRVLEVAPGVDEPAK